MEVKREVLAERFGIVGRGFSEVTAPAAAGVYNILPVVDNIKSIV